MERRGSTIVVLAAAAAGVLTLVGAAVWIVVHPVPRARDAARDGGVDGEAPPQADDGYVYADARVTVDPGPAVLRAELPPLDAHGDIAWDTAHVPRGHVTGRVCAGDPEMLERVARAMRSEADAMRAIVGYTAPFDDCYAVGACAWAREAAVEDARPERERTLAWWVLASCDDADSDAMFARTDVPAVAVARREEHASLAIGHVDPAWNDAFGEALVDEVGITGSARGRWIFRATLSIVAHVPGPRAGAALLAAYDASTSYQTRTAIAASMFLHHDARSVSLRRAACAAGGDAADAFCQWRPKPPPAPVVRSSDLAASVLAHEVTPVAAAADATIPVPRRAAALAACVDGMVASEPWTAVACLDALAELDLGAARRAAGPYVGASNGWLSSVARSVLIFPSHAALCARLDTLGLGARRPSPAGAYTGWDVQRTLEDGGRSLTFGSENDRVPMDHDALLAELASLGGDALSDVAFREVARPRDAARTTDYMLDAFASGHAYRVAAADYGAYYDLRRSSVCWTPLRAPAAATCAG